MRASVVAVPPALAWLLVGCITPALIEEAGRPELQLSERLRALGGEPVEVDVGTGERLRGVYLPAHAGDPIVVHFLGSGSSVTTGAETAGLTFDLDELFVEFQRASCASLALDYRGVGASDGSRDPRHLSADALAAWNEALARA